MRDAPQHRVPARGIGIGLARHVAGQPPRALQEPQLPTRGDVRPVDVVAGWSGEDHRQPDRVDTVDRQLLGQVDAVAEGLAHRLALVDDLALVEQRAERLGELDRSHVVQHLGEEPAVQQVQNRMLDAADVLVDRHPPAQGLGIERPFGVSGRGVAHVVPRGVHERIHGVGVTPRRTSARRAVHVNPSGRRRQRRNSLRREVGAPQVGQLDRQLVVRDGDLAARTTVDDGDRAPPVPLPGHQPVAQPERDRTGPEALGLQPGDDPGLRLLDRQAVQAELVVGGVDGWAVTAIRLAVEIIRRPYGTDDRELVGRREVPVTLVLARHSHDRARAVVGQDVVGGVGGDPSSVDGVDGVYAQEHPGLLPLGGETFHLGAAPDLFEVGVERSTLLGRADLLCERGIGGDDEERGAEQRVRPRGEDRDRGLSSVDDEVDGHTFGAADPVPLHRQDPLRPGRFQRFQVVKQPLRVVGDLEVPLGQLALGDRGPAAFTVAPGDLFIGQHRLVPRAPVDRGSLAIREATLVETQKQPLGPAVVLRVARAHPAAPVERGAVALERLRLSLDVRVRPLRRMRAVTDGGVLGRQPEAIPPNRVEHVVPALEPVPCEQITERIRLTVSHVQVTGGIREHVQHVASLTRILGAGGVTGGGREPVCPERIHPLPDRQPSGLNPGEVVCLVAA